MIPFLPSLLLLGLVMSRWWISDMQTPGASALWSLAVALLCLFLFLQKHRPRALPGDFRVGLVLAALALGSLLWSVDRGETLFAAVPLLAVLLLAAACRLGLQSAALAWAMLLGAAGASGVALRQAWVALPALQNMVRSGEIAVDAATRNNIMAGRAFATFFAPDMLGGALAGGLMIGLGLVGAQRGWRRSAALSLTILIGLGLVSSKSVGAALALLVALLPLALGLLQRQSRRALLAGAALVLAVGLAAAWTALPRLQKISYRAQTRLKDQRLAVETGLDAPLLGHGHNTFASAPWSRRRHKHPLTRYAHGWLGQSFSDLGLAGLGLVASLLLIWLWRSLGLLRQAPGQIDWLRLGAFSGLTAVLTHGLFDYDLMFGENLAVLWLCAALSSPMPAAVAFQAQGRRRWGLAALAALGVVLASWQSAARLAESADHTPDCVRQIAVQQKVANWAPPLTSRYISLARSIERCQALGPDRLRQSIQMQQRAVNTSPLDAVLRSDLALLLARAGERDRAEREITRAQQQWPMVGRVYLRWAQVAWLAGQHQRARTMARRALLLDRATPKIAREAGALLSATP